MKYLYSIITLLLFTFGYSQTSIDFEDDGFGAGLVWTADQTDSSFAVVDNTVSDAINSSAKVGALTCASTTPAWGLAFATYNVTFDSTNATVTMDVLKDGRAVNVAVKFEDSVGGTSKEVSATASGSAGWETLSFDFSSLVDNGITYDKIVIIPDFAARTETTVTYFDNVEFSAAQVSNVFTPNAPATAPTVDAADVISVYSDSYTSVITNSNPNWGQTTQVSEETLFSNNFLKYTDLTYQGMEYTASDVDAKEYLHLDYFIGTESTTAFSIFLIGGGEIEKVLDVTAKGSWVSVDINLADFDGVNLTSVNQFKFTGNGTVYVDNLYFHGASTRVPPPADPQPDQSAPSPTPDASEVISVYSDPYTSVGISEINPGWGQLTQQSEIDLTGDMILKYKNLNYQGMTFTSSDVSSKKFLHIDYWISSQSTTGFQLFLISPGVENAYDLDVSVKDQWVSVDIDLSNYIADLTDVFQFKFVDTVGGGLVYVDNLYFHGTADPPAPAITSVDLDFEDASDASNWTPSNPSMAFTHVETGGNPGGALEFGFYGGGDHRLSYTGSNFDYTGAATARITFDILQSSATLAGTAIHFRSSTTGTDDASATFVGAIQSEGINASTWTSFQYDETVTNDSDLIFISFQIAQGAFPEAEGVFLLDNVAVTLLDENGATLSTYEIETPQFITYPNPLQNTLNVKGTMEVENISIYDLMGRNVLNAAPNKSEFSLDVSHLNKGVYMVQLKAGDKETTLKVIK